MNPYYYSHQDVDGYNVTSSFLSNDNNNDNDDEAPMMVSSFALTQGDSAPQAGAAGLVGSPHDSTDENEQQQEGKETMKGSRKDAPWSTDWKKETKERFDEALEAYKVHVNTLYNAIETYVDESNAVHDEWYNIQQDELAEAERLDGVEPDIAKVTMSGGDAASIVGALAALHGNHDSSPDSLE